jgi:hypothetical protein
MGQRTGSMCISLQYWGGILRHSKRLSQGNSLGYRPGASILCACLPTSGAAS